MTILTIGTKKCSKCQAVKSLSEFWRDASRFDGYHYRCATCQHRHEKSYQLQKAYGITLEEYDRLLTAQGNVCAICNGKQQGTRSLAVDHDHTTGEVRGLLCHNCNRAIGLFADDPDRLLTAVNYLTKGGE